MVGHVQYAFMSFAKNIWKTPDCRFYKNTKILHLKQQYYKNISFFCDERSNYRGWPCHRNYRKIFKSPYVQGACNWCLLLAVNAL